MVVPTEVSYDEPGKLKESDKKQIKASDIEAISRNLDTVSDTIVSSEEKRLLNQTAPENRVKFLRERFLKRDYDVVDEQPAPSESGWKDKDGKWRPETKPAPAVDVGAQKPSQGSPDEWKTPESGQPKKSTGTQTEDDMQVGARGGSVQGQVAKMLMGAAPDGGLRVEKPMQVRYGKDAAWEERNKNRQGVGGMSEGSWGGKSQGPDVDPTAAVLTDGKQKVYVTRDFDPTKEYEAVAPGVFRVKGNPNEFRVEGEYKSESLPSVIQKAREYEASQPKSKGSEPGMSPRGQMMRMAMGATPAQERLAEQEANVGKVKAQGEQHGQEDLAALQSIASKGAAAAEAGKQAQDAASPSRFIADQVDRRVFGDEPLIPEAVSSTVKDTLAVLPGTSAEWTGGLMQGAGDMLGMQNLAKKGAELKQRGTAAIDEAAVAQSSGQVAPQDTAAVSQSQVPVDQMVDPRMGGSMSMSAKIPSLGFRQEGVDPQALKDAAASRLKMKTNIENAQDTMAALDIARDGAVRKYAEREALVQSEAAKLSQLATQAKLDSVEEAKGYQTRKLALAEQARIAASTPTDPNRFWNNKDAGQKAAAVIAGALFGFTGQGMQWLQRLDGLVEADNRLQAQDRAAKVQGFQAEAEALGEAGREAIRNGATVAEAHIIDRQTKLEGLKSYLDVMTMKVNNMEAKQRGLQMSADMDKLLADYDQQQLQLAQQRADKKTEWNYKNALLKKEEFEMRAKVGKDDTTGVKGPQAMELGSLMAAEAVARDLKAKFGEKNIISRMLDKGAAFIPGTDAKAYNIARDQAINMIAPLMGAGVLQKHDLDRWEGLMAKAGDVNGEEILNILLTDIRSTYNSKRAALGAAGMDVRQFPVLGGGGAPSYATPR
jgi:hypothetical protein